MAHPQRLYRPLLVHLWCALLVLALPLLAIAQTPVPTLDSPVVDPTGVLSASTTEHLQQQSRGLFARSGGAQLQVLVVASTGDESIEDYAQRVYDQWQLGRKGVDDGVLLLVAVQDRRVRIQPGYGLEGAIPDAYAKRIIEETMLPRFRTGDIDQGVMDGSAQLVKLIDGEPLPPPPSSNPLDLAWSNFDSVMSSTALLAFFMGLWRSPRMMDPPPLRRPGGPRKKRRKAAATAAEASTGTAVPARRWWRAPLEWLGAILAGTLLAAVMLPRAVIGVGMLLTFVVPVAWGCGRSWRRSRGTRRTLWTMLAISVVLAVTLQLTRGVFPGLVIHVAAYVALAVLAFLVALPCIVARACWQRSRVEFAVRLLVYLIVAGFAALWIADRSSDADAGMAMWALGGVAAYVGWILMMAQGGVGGGGGGSSSGGRSRPSSSSSSSSSSNWSGGGGRSGGGGASGNW